MCLSAAALAEPLDCPTRTAIRVQFAMLYDQAGGISIIVAAPKPSLQLFDNVAKHSLSSCTE